MIGMQMFCSCSSMRRPLEALLNLCTNSVIDLQRCRHACIYLRESGNAALSSFLRSRALFFRTRIDSLYLCQN